jgi:phosphate transport system ATP-binding protein
MNTANPNTTLILENICVSFNGQTVLNRINITLDRGMINMAVGPSGSGKTTLLRAVNRLNETFPGCCTTGTVKIGFKNGWTNAYDSSVPLARLRHKVGMVFQHPNVLPFSILKNFTLPLSLTLGMKRHVARDKTEQVLREVRLWDEVKDRLQDNAMTLSGGQQQRLCLARALAMEPEILLLDEPTASLDFQATRKIEELFLDLKSRYTILAVTHSLNQMRRLADRVLVMNHGKLLKELDRNSLLDQHACDSLFEDVF